jgi:hypothetical protein
VADNHKQYYFPRGELLKEKWETFRFMDEQLQSSLIRMLRNAGIEHKVAEDGTVLYLQEQPVEQFINQLVETVFPNNYYRTEISDPVKAERYRRFKKFAGTPFIEEIYGGRTYFVQELYEKLYCYRGIPTHISFILTDENLEPDKVTELLGVLPTFACLKDEPFTRPYALRRKDAVSPSSLKGWWELCSIPHLEANDINLHLEWLLKIVEPMAGKLKSLAEKSANKDFRALQIEIVRPKRSIGGVSLPGSMLERLGILCDRVDIRFWPDDYI